MSDAPALEIRGVAKRFGATAALDGVDLAVRAGEVHALVGENGAGKSTLMSVIAGAQRPDRGAMSLGGRTYAPSSPLDARRAGVALIHQELSLCPHLSVAENVSLGTEPARRGIVDRAAARHPRQHGQPRRRDPGLSDLVERLEGRAGEHVRREHG